MIKKPNPARYVNMHISSVYEYTGTLVHDIACSGDESAPLAHMDKH